MDVVVPPMKRTGLLGTRSLGQKAPHARTAAGQRDKQGGATTDAQTILALFIILGNVFGKTHELR